MKILEKDIQKGCLDYLKLVSVFAYKINNVGVYKQATGSYIPAQTKGIPDIIMHWPVNEVSYLEIKTPKGRMSEAQIAFQSQCMTDGVRYYIIRDIDELRAIIEL